MKHLTLLLTLVFASLTGFAQEEVAIEQHINQPVNQLIINPGWNVHLLHNEADSGYRVAIVTTDDLAAFAYNVQLCSLKGDTLVILENMIMPQGTVVEIEGPMALGRIVVKPRATAKADLLIAPAPSGCDWTDLFVGKDANLHIQRYHIPDIDSSPTMDVWDNAQLTIDTIMGEGNAVVNVYAADFQYGTIALKGRISLNEHENTAVWDYQEKDSRIIRGKEVDGKWTTTNRRKVWNNSLSIGASLGFRTGINPRDINSPLLQNGTLSFNFGVSTYFRFNNRWGLSTGVLANANRTTLSHQVKYENNELTVTDGQGEYQHNYLASHYVGIPVTLYCHLGKRRTESVSLDFYFARLCSEKLLTSNSTSFLAQGGFGWLSDDVDGIFNPWKLEVGLSFNTLHLGIIHGVRVYTNLLPEYKSGITDSKFHTVGVEFQL